MLTSALSTHVGRARWVWAGLALVMLVHASLATWVNLRSSVAYDEYAHIAAGAAYVSSRQGVAIYNLSPPLARVPAGLMARLFGAKVPYVGQVIDVEPTSRHWVFADRFAQANATHYESLVRFVRLSTLPMSVAGLMLVFLLARRFWGERSGVFASLVVAFEPGYVAHASLVGTDLPLVVAVLFTLWAGLRYRDEPCWKRTFVLVIACVCLLGVKFSAIAAMPVILWLWGSAARSTGQYRRAINHLLAGVMLVWLAVILAYPIEFVRVWQIKPLTPTIAWVLQSLPSRTWLPFSAILLEGFDAQAYEAAGKYPGMLFGQVYQGSHPLYWPMVVLTKWPVGVLALLGLAVWKIKALRAAWPAMALAGLFTLVIVLGTSINIGVRYLMPVIPLVVIGSAGLLAVDRVRRLALLAATCVPLELATNLPNPLGFYNTPARLVNSADNIVQDEDWSQSLIDLRSWMQANQVNRVRLAYWGRVDPSLYGVAYDPIDQFDSVAGYVVLSRQAMTGVPLRMQTVSTGPQVTSVPNLQRLSQIPPDAKLGSLWAWRADRVKGLL